MLGEFKLTRKSRLIFGTSRFSAVRPSKVTTRATLQVYALSLHPHNLETADMNGLVPYDSSSDDEGAETVVGAQKVGAQSFINGTAQGLVQEAVHPRTAGSTDATNHAGGDLLGPKMPEDMATSYAEQSENDTMRELTRPTHPMSAIPESPQGSPDQTANARIERFLELKARGVHFNEDLASRTTFRNPSLLSNMMKRAGLSEEEQYTTSLPTALWDPSSFPEWSYKEALLKTQQELREKDEAAKKAHSAAGQRRIEFATSSNSGGSNKSTPNQPSKRRRHD